MERSKFLVVCLSLGLVSFVFYGTAVAQKITPEKEAQIRLEAILRANKVIATPRQPSADELLEAILEKNKKDQELKDKGLPRTPVIGSSGQVPVLRVDNPYAEVMRQIAMDHKVVVYISVAVPKKVSSDIAVSAEDIKAYTKIPDLVIKPARYKCYWSAEMKDAVWAEVLEDQDLKKAQAQVTQPLVTYQAFPYPIQGSTPYCPPGQT